MHDLAARARAHRWRAEPWRNGRGVTYVIARWPDQDDYDVRVSIAEVSEPGPFSTFPGRTRWSTLVSDGAIELAGRALVRGLPLELAGDEAVVATVVDGPVTLLNIVAWPRHVEVGSGPPPTDADFTFEEIVWLRRTRSVR